jgi:hypothetical protein
MKKLGIVLVALVGLSGCKSAFVDADVKNETGGVISPVEIDYPSASFGKETVAAGNDFHYRFKILGSGGTTVMWTDAGRQQHSVKGPNLHEGQEGRVVITIGPTTATWETSLQH